MSTPKAAAAAAFYCVYLLVVLEVALRLIFFHTPLLDWLVPARPETEPEKRLYWIRHHAPGSEYLAGYSFHRPDPELGWSMVPGSSGTIDDGRPLHLNSRGLRSQKEFSYERTSASPRIAVFGDSFTFGGEASDNEVYSYLLQRDFPHAEVMNFGVSGYGQDQMLRYFENEGVKYRPDIVILGFVLSDCERIPFSFRDYGKPQAYLDGAKLAWKNIPVPSPKEYLAKEPFRLKILDLARIFYELHWRASPAYAKDESRTCTTILSEFSAVSRKIGAKPVFVYLPIRETLGDPGGRFARDEENTFFDMCHTAQAACISTREAFAEGYAKGDRYTTNRHYQALEHRVTARVIAEYLKSKKN